MEHIVVKIIQLGSEVQSFAMAPGSTVGQLFEQAGKEFKCGEVTRNHANLTENTTLCDGDTIYVAKVVKGNLDPFEVEIFRLGGGRSITLPANDGMTIRNVLDQLPEAEKANFFRSNGQPTYDFRITGVNEPVSVETALPRPTSGKVRVICSQVVKGNS